MEKERNAKGQYVKILDEEEAKRRQREYQKKWRQENPEKVKARQEKYRQTEKYRKTANEYKKKRYHAGLDKESIEKYQNSEKGQKAAKKAKKKWQKNNPEMTLEKDRRLVKNLSPCYVKNKLKRQGFTSEQLENNPEIIEVKTIIIKTKRLCRTSQS